MKQQTQERTLQSDAYRKALMAALGLNVQDVGYSKEGGFSGGLRPSALGAQGQQAAQVLSGQAQHALESPEARPELDAYTRFKIGDQQAYQDPTVGKKPGFWAKAGYGLNPFKVDELFKSRDPNYRKPGSVSPVNTTGFMGNAPNTY
jgi:hypothetical protein